MGYMGSTLQAGFGGGRCISQTWGPSPANYRAKSSACSPTLTSPHLPCPLQENGAKIDAVDIRTLDVPSAGRPLDVVVAGEGWWRWWRWDVSLCHCMWNQWWKGGGRRAGHAQVDGQWGLWAGVDQHVQILWQWLSSGCWMARLGARHNGIY